MALTSGTKLGPYEIAAQLGAGGMGEVYRARDTRLERTVAIKILPAHLSNDPEAKERFDREARAISSLSHPNICHLYDVGVQDGTSYLVMEYLEGETLAERLRKGPLPVEQFVKAGIEICEGLEKAHRSGVVHRDLKPGNIMLTKSGTKLMDFGLAKAIPTAASTSGLTASFNTPATNQPVTARGTVVGTFQYMAPDQLLGREADARSDVFSLGAVLYEMFTAQRAFEGKSPLSVASAILEREPPPISSIKPMAPPALDHVIGRCLAKDPEERWQTARDVGLELKWISETAWESEGTVPVAARRRFRHWLGWGVAGMLALAAIGLAIGFVLRTPKPPQPMQLSADIGADAKIDIGHGPAVVLSPDDARLAFVASGPEQTRRIYVRPLDGLQATALSGTENAETPFFSPDGRWLGFFADRKLKKISIEGGAAVTLCDVAYARGGSWGEDGTIAFVPGARSALSEVSSAGGAPRALTILDQRTAEVGELWPQWLPGSKAVLFTSGGHGANYEEADVIAYTVSSGQRKTVLHGGYYARYVRSGHLLYMHEGSLFSAPIDLSRLEVTGTPVPILDNISANPGDGSAQFSLSESGNMAYVAGHSRRQLASIEWMDRQGKFTPLRETPCDYYAPALSPDGKRLALAINDGKRIDIWVYELTHDTMTRLTFAGHNLSPIWTPDGQRITYRLLEKGGATDLYWTRADGTGNTLRLTQTKTRKFLGSWHPDGKLLAFDELAGDENVDATRSSLGNSSIFILPMDGNEKLGWKPGEPKPLPGSTSTEDEASFSPDGRWLAYRSNESGELEIYVRPYPGPGGKWQISTGGGSFPKWSPSGKELLYRTQDNRIMVVTYNASGDSFRANKPELWSPGQFSERLGAVNFDVSPDGKRVVVLRAPVSETSPITKVNFIFNFFDELRSKSQPQK
jgi:eukaryotic-like serine/threonine-protein kinase